MDVTQRAAELPVNLGLMVWLSFLRGWGDVMNTVHVHLHTWPTAKCQQVVRRDVRLSDLHEPITSNTVYKSTVCCAAEALTHVWLRLFWTSRSSTLSRCFIAPYDLLMEALFLEKTGAEFPCTVPFACNRLFVSCSGCTCWTSTCVGESKGC